MSDDVTTGVIAAGIYAVARAIEGGFSMLAKLFKRKNAEDAKAREEARQENAERDQWAKMNKIEDRVTQHELDDVQRFATLEAKVDRAIEDIREVGKDVKTMLRRQTGEVNNSKR